MLRDKNGPPVEGYYIRMGLYTKIAVIPGQNWVEMSPEFPQILTPGPAARASGQFWVFRKVKQKITKAFT